MDNGQWKMDNGKWTIYNGQSCFLTVVHCPLSIVRCPLSIVNYLLPVVATAFLLDAVAFSDLAAVEDAELLLAQQDLAPTIFSQDAFSSAVQIFVQSFDSALFFFVEAVCSV